MHLTDEGSSEGGLREEELRMGERPGRAGDKSGCVGREGARWVQVWVAASQSSLPSYKVSPVPINCSHDV